MWDALGVEVRFHGSFLLLEYLFHLQLHPKRREERAVGDQEDFADAGS